MPGIIWYDRGLSPTLFQAYIFYPKRKEMTLARQI